LVFEKEKREEEDEEEEDEEEEDEEEEACEDFNEQDSHMTCASTSCLKECLLLSLSPEG